MINHKFRDRIRKYSIITLFIIISIFLLSHSVLSVYDTWDRPVNQINYTEITLNFTQMLDDERNARIGNDTLLQSQINTTNNNITQLYNITATIQNNITNIYTIIYMFEYNITELYGITDDIYDDIDDIYQNISAIDENIVALNGSINSLNDTLTNFTALINATINDLNNTIQLVNASIKQPSGIYIDFNNTNFWIKENELNNTINNIAENREYLYITTINVTSGTGTITTNYTIEYLLTRITINGIGIYRSECVEYTNATIIDKNRIPHNTLWDIEKNYAINDKINCTITSAVTDGIYNITLTYINNGIV